MQQKSLKSMMLAYCIDGSTIHTNPKSVDCVPNEE